MMRDLTLNELEDVSGGILINPLTVALVIRAGTVAAPVIRTTFIAIAGAIGVYEGGKLAEQE